MMFSCSPKETPDLRPPRAARAFTGAALFAVLSRGAVIGLLFALHSVGQMSVAQGAARQRAAALLNDAIWRCNALRTRQPYEACPAQARAQPSSETSARPRDLGALAPALALGR
jgi:hypothetical protein